jgi:23S rRNA (adenine2503-C2)-methyltransferase
MSRFPTVSNGKVDIKSLDLAGLHQFLDHIGESQEKAQRIYQALWQKHITSFHELNTIPKSTRAKLEKTAEIYFLDLAEVLPSSDGCKKFLWRIPLGGVIESVLIPDENRGDDLSDRLTLCISSQWGCAMKCSFCLTGDLGLKAQLSAAQIACQIQQVSQTLPPGKRITNIVLMGMGEPLHNYDNLTIALRTMLHDYALCLSHRKITVSTVGLVPALRRLTEELPVNLAISLNATTEEQRRKVMPISRKYSLQELLRVCKEIPLPSGKRITFEYVMMAGFNDSLDDAERLLDLLREVPSKINLIPYNENPDRQIKRPTLEQVKAFQTYIVTRGIHCSIRKTRGIDISAACGQLGKANQHIY